MCANKMKRNKWRDLDFLETQTQGLYMLFYPINLRCCYSGKHTEHAHHEGHGSIDSPGTSARREPVSFAVASSRVHQINGTQDRQITYVTTWIVLHYAKF